jgi:hypothetical protein
MKNRLCSNLLFVLFALSFASLSAQAGNVFEVQKIKVDASAASTSLARAAALRDGQTKALSMAMRRLTKQEEWEKLPDIQALDFENLVEGLRISDEKTGPGRYLATLSVQFKPGPLRELLRGVGVAITEVQSQPALLLPVLEDLAGLQSWGEHWWRQEWAAHDIDNSLAPMLLPLGDLEDTEIANAEDILIGDPAKLQRLNERYGTDTVVVAHALADVDGQLGVTAYIFGAEESDVIVKTYRTGTPHAQMARRAIDEVMGILAARWKSVAAVVSDEKQVLQVRASYTSLSDWTRLLDRLNAVDLVREVTIVELTKNYAYVDLAYIGSVPQLTNNLDQNELVLGGSLTARQVANVETAKALGVAVYVAPILPDTGLATDPDGAAPLGSPVPGVAPVVSPVITPAVSPVGAPPVVPSPPPNQPQAIREIP